VSPQTPYAAVGGEVVLRAIIDEFVDAMFEDVMIGFFFRDADRQRIKEMEFRFTARFLGADIEYNGRPIAEVHAKHAIMGGQFDRRTRILAETRERHGVLPGIRADWLAHVESLRPAVTKDAAGECDPDRAMASPKPTAVDL
jgi:hemoglobin